MSLRRVDGQPIYHHAGLPNILSYDFLSYKLLFSKEKNPYIFTFKFWYFPIISHRASLLMKISTIKEWTQPSNLLEAHFF